MRDRGRTTGSAALALLLFLWSAGSTTGVCLPPPQGVVVLRVSGAVGCTNAEGEARFDLALLASLGTTRLATRTPWTEGVGVFEGVGLRRLMEAVGARGESVRAIALNDYAADIPFEEFARYRVLIAWSLDGRRLSRRDKGPLWIVYPWSEVPELDSRTIRQHSVWQLERLVVR